MHQDTIVKEFREEAAKFGEITSLEAVGWTFKLEFVTLESAVQAKQVCMCCLAYDKLY
jgi:hypothetical protein